MTQVVTLPLYTGMRVMTDVTAQVIELVNSIEVSNPTHTDTWNHKIQDRGCDGLATKDTLKELKQNTKTNQGDIIDKINKDMYKLKSLVDDIVSLKTQLAEEFRLHAIVDRRLAGGEYNCAACDVHTRYCECND